jgi:predicted metal-dependent enzyme (double-stranded beta helix superfamily)
MHTKTQTRPGLDHLVHRIRGLVDSAGAAKTTAWAVADLLRKNLPPLDLLSADERIGDDSGYARHLLHAEARFSIVAVVWQPGQLTEIHDHIAWCTFAVLQGVEYEILYRDQGDHLRETGRVANKAGDVSGFAPPGDIHLVHNTGDTTAISLHIYGADLSQSPSSVRRVYDLPVV